MLDHVWASQIILKKMKLLKMGLKMVFGSCKDKRMQHSKTEQCELFKGQWVDLTIFIVHIITDIDTGI